MGWVDLPDGCRLRTVLSTNPGSMDRWIWVLFDPEGELLATAGTTYTKEGDAKRGAQRTYEALKRELDGAPLTQKTVQEQIPGEDPTNPHATPITRQG